jgi:hypothetical protein
MPVYCTFALNKKTTSALVCSGFGAVEAYSGHGKGRDNPDDVADQDVGALPPGTYYLIDRQSGGRFGWLHDFQARYFGSTDRQRWFMLWNSRGGDVTMIGGIKRGAFRLHPEGPLHLSDGCITVKSGALFDRLQSYIRSNPPDMVVPGTSLKAYGTVQVR